MCVCVCFPFFLGVGGGIMQEYAEGCMLRSAENAVQISELCVLNEDNQGCCEGFSVLHW